MNDRFSKRETQAKAAQSGWRNKGVTDEGSIDTEGRREREGRERRWRLEDIKKIEMRI